MQHLQVPKANHHTKHANQHQSDRSQSSVRSNTSNLSALSARHKVPDYMKYTLQQQQSTQQAFSEKKPNKEKIAKGSKLGDFLQQVVHDKQQLIMCQICSGLFKKAKEEKKFIYLANCEHKNNFCQSCLHTYTIHKVNNLEQVFCPHEECPAILETQGQFFRNLPIEIQRKYMKISEFHQAHKDDPNIKLCPIKQCGGIIRASGIETELICSNCHHLFCIDCLLPAHTGSCSQQEKKAYIENLHYRQCPKCHKVVDAYKGTNKIVCNCGYERCYVCNQPWDNSHYSQHDMNGDLMATALRTTVQAGGNKQEKGCCEDIFCYNKGGSKCSLVAKMPVKCFIAFFYTLVMMLVFLLRDLTVILVVCIAGLIAGMFGFSFVVLCGYTGAKFVLGVLFFPAMMVIGVVKGFEDYFGRLITETLSEFGASYMSGLRDWCRF